MARFITVPTEVTIKGVDEKGAAVTKPFKWEEFLRLLMADDRFKDGFSDIFQAIDLNTKLLAAETVGEVIELSDTEWRILDGIAKKPGLPFAMSSQLEVYLRAVCDAPTKKLSALRDLNPEKDEKTSKGRAK